MHGPSNACIAESAFVNSWKSEHRRGGPPSMADLAILVSRCRSTFDAIGQYCGLVRPMEGAAAKGSLCAIRKGIDLTIELMPRTTVESDASSFEIMDNREQ